VECSSASQKNSVAYRVLEILSHIYTQATSRKVAGSKPDEVES
jgi:hypothetical protein